MSPRRETLPPPGVSAIGEMGEHTPVDSGPRPGRRAAPRPTPSLEPPVAPEERPAGGRRRRGEDRRREGEDPLQKAIETGRVRQVESGGKVDIVEAPLQSAATGSRGIVSYTSIDGQTYRIRNRDERTGQPIKDIGVYALLLAVREMALGGDPFDVYDALNVRLKDIDGKVIYPCPR